RDESFTQLGSDHAAGTAVLPAEGGGTRRPGLRPDLPGDHHAVHRRADVRSAFREEDVRPYRAPRCAPADPVGHLQLVLPGRPRADRARAAAQRDRAIPGVRMSDAAPPPVAGPEVPRPPEQPRRGSQAMFILGVALGLVGTVIAGLVVFGIELGRPSF